MPVTPEELVRVLAMLAEEEKLRVTVKETLKGGAMAGTGAVIGGMLGGPVGIAVGGAVGGVAGAWMTAGKFRPVHEVLNEMEPHKRAEIYNAFQNILHGLDYNDVNTLVLLATSDMAVRSQLIGGLAGHMTARWYGKGKFREVSEILTSLEREKREELHQKYQPILMELEQDDGTSLHHRIAMDGELRDKMLSTLKTYLTETLKETLQDNHVERGKAD
ncbi:Protein C19orf12-like [Holothuria leucospilota]|uniref:Protein C19orf12-like n=1 Tax=Holothuria leucospilota TaxID=206669 RepID=A0A9Q1HDB3_HOLLE|nr:Protein C19orf12-like [Holothuria leucospilota]